MGALLVVNNPSHWPVELQGAEVVAARTYLTDPAYADRKQTRVFNCCRSFEYQSLGYYVSLLAEARGHRPIPDATTLQDMKSGTLIRAIADDLDHLIQTTLRPVKPDDFTLSIYFGRTLAKRDRSLGAKLFGLFRCPLLRCEFRRTKGRWVLRSIGAAATRDLPQNHWPFVLESAGMYFSRPERAATRVKRPKYYLAILIDPDERQPPSDEAAIKKFIRAAARKAVSVELITRDDYARLGAFDALFIRTTTQMNHFTYRFARRAAAEGLAVIDDPVSIARCTNKVFLSERLEQAGVATPRTVVVHRDNADHALESLGLPCVLKQPDSAFSVGVSKAETPDEFREKVAKLLADSELIVAQEFTPTDFDWRVGVLDGKPLYVCKYFMARQHWQIINHGDGGKITEGGAATMAVEDAPPRVVRAAVKAARLIGDGLYGVDLKQVGRRVLVIEVNDNPNLDAGYEDKVLKNALYDAVIDSFIQRIERIRQGGGRSG